MRTRPPNRSNDTAKKLLRYWVVYFLILPPLMCLFVFHYLPIIMGITMAFTDYRIGSGFTAIFTSPFVGLKHFARFFNSMFFGRVIGNTLIINMMKLIFYFPAPIIFAILINEIRAMMFKRTVQTVSYLPSFLSGVIIYGLVLSFLSPSYGLLNAARHMLGLEPVHFLALPGAFRWILVLIDMWRYMGWDAIIFLAALTSVDPEMLESAAIDGASRFRRIWHITLPGISEIIVLLLILNIGNMLNGDFQTVFLLYSPPVYPVADIIDTFVYREGLVNTQYSFTAAVGLFKSAVGFVLIMGTNRIAKKYGKEGIW